MEIIQLIMDYGVDTLMIALCTVVFTGLFKIPIKKLADKTENSKNITRFITLLPIFFGFGLTALSSFLLTKRVYFDKDFYSQWLSSVSLSLATYAFWEKFVPSEKKFLSEAEINVNKSTVEELKSMLVDNKNDSKDTETQIMEQAEIERKTEHKKIVISNNKKLK